MSISVLVSGTKERVPYSRRARDVILHVSQGPMGAVVTCAGQCSSCLFESTKLLFVLLLFVAENIHTPLLGASEKATDV